MNYYSHHIGDYLTATAHLSILEDGVYRRLMDRYYTTEQALPSDEVLLFRLLRARSDDEKDAVRVVLNEFFYLSDGLWRHKRCDVEIAAYKAKSEKAIKSAEKRWKPNADALLEKELLQDGDMRTQCERIANALPTQCQPITNNQEPITNNQEPINPTPPPLVVEKTGEAGVLIKPEVALSIAFRSFGIKTQPANPKLIELAKQGVTVNLVNAACEDARSAKPDAGFNYVVAIIERWCKEASALQVKGAAIPQARASPSGSASDKRSNWMNELRGDGNGQNENQRIIDVN